MTGARGYMLLELLLGAAITCAVSAVLFQFAVAAHGAVAVQGDAADQQQRLRVALEGIRHHLVLAGAGPSRGPGRGPLADVFAPVLPARIGVSNPDPDLTVRTDRLSILYVPDTRAQTTLLSGMAAASSPLAIDGGSPGCSPGTACDFIAGDRAVIYEASRPGSGHELFTIGSVDAARALLTPSVPLSRAYAAGARVAVIIVRTYYLDAVGKRLMQYDGDRSELPLVDRVADIHVVYVADPRPNAVPSLPLADLGGSIPIPLAAAQLGDGPFCGEAPNRFDADLLRVRRVRVTIRLQGELSGTIVRDLEATLDVAPPNMAPR